MKIKLSFAELHTPLFLGGKNFGLKLISKNTTDPDLTYDQSEKELWVEHNKKIAIIPCSNVVSMTPFAPSIMPDSVPAPIAPAKKVKAQASTPMDHVFSEGPGKTHD